MHGYSYHFRQLEELMIALQSRTESNPIGALNSAEDEEEIESTLRKVSDLVQLFIVRLDHQSFALFHIVTSLKVLSRWKSLLLQHMKLSVRSTS